MLETFGQTGEREVPLISWPVPAQPLTGRPGILQRAHRWRGYMRVTAFVLTVERLCVANR